MFVYNVKRMIRGLGDVLCSTHSQTLNVYAPAVALIELAGGFESSCGPALVSRICDEG